MGRHAPVVNHGGFYCRALVIHPFQDGNGRLSSILTTLLLLRASYEYVPCVSLESIIEENKDLYYLLQGTPAHTDNAQG